ncbi:MAG: aminotransferase class I/II-fold pyridoxal phosphate-dependent enzyme [Candidatus Latescibacteria bacterium]|nr:aminotransferase class I/II-fold pyridoxal phosphate-dependent enzyme [Candidatus Latescibacterota bacterium]
MSTPFKGIETQLIHAGEVRVEGAVCLPVFQSSTFEYSGQGSYHDLKYIRLNNTPNHHALHTKLAAIEGGEAALVMASGMAAISTALIAFLKAGDHLLAQSCLYGGTHSFITQDLPDLGVTFDFIDGNDPDSWAGKLRPETRAIYVETMTNPLLEVPDLRAVVRFARAHDLVSMVDNTFASPVNFRPLAHGFDLSLHSCTKYLNGHSDIVAGCVIGKETHVSRILHKLNHLGGSLDPHACFLLHRGMKTLALRVRQQNENALRLSQFLSAHPAVERVNYPGLETHPQHRRARELFEGCGGVLSFEMRGGVKEADALISRLKLPISAPSLGGVESLITRPVTTSHSGLSREEHARVGINDKLIRVAVGIESPDDLCADFEQALEGL